MKRAALIFSWTSIAELFANLSIDTVVLGDAENRSFCCVQVLLDNELFCY